MPLDAVAQRNVSWVPSSLHAHAVASSGTIDWRLTCLTFWSNNVRLLNTPIIGPTAKMVASSKMDMVAGLSGE
jgi:hypothetical protein